MITCFNRDKNGECLAYKVAECCPECSARIKTVDEKINLLTCLLARAQAKKDRRRLEEELEAAREVKRAWEAGKLFHIDLNDQYPGRYYQDLRFGSRDIKAAFYLVKFLEDVKYNGSRHFDAHAYRTEDYEGVKDFARGCMRSYLILKEKAERWNADKEIQSIVAAISADDGSMNKFFGKYSSDKAKALKAESFDRTAISSRGLKYELLDQLTNEVLMGVR